jgi:hypothetical protein
VARQPSGKRRVRRRHRGRAAHLETTVDSSEARRAAQSLAHNSAGDREPPDSV